MYVAPGMDVHSAFAKVVTDLQGSRNSSALGNIVSTTASYWY